MQVESARNKRIAKNTILLYFRMLVIMAVQFYTARVILNVLGVEDYGIYNVVGGVVVLFSFIYNSLSSASQRFLSFALGCFDIQLVKDSFNTCIHCHILMCLIVLLLAETLGIWFVYEKLILPEGRRDSALLVYQITILTTIINILRVPYNATIISYEKMSFFAFASVFEAISKLGIIFLLDWLNFDKLVTYSILILLTTVFLFTIYYFYCHHSFSICNFRWKIDKILAKKMVSYSGWTMLSSAVTVGNQQGGNMMLNVFFGVVNNAAYGIANQVSSAIYSFVTNFQMAFQPQIVKLYASKEYDSLNRLIYRSASLSYYLLLVISIPFIIDCDWILKIWLVNPPEHAGIFCNLLIAYFLVDAIQAPLWMVIGASGNIKNYTIWSSAITIINLPIVYIILNNGGGVIWVFAIRVVLNLVCAIVRVPYVKKFIDITSSSYLMIVVVPAVFTTIISCVLSYFAKDILGSPLLSIVFSFLITLSSILFIGLNRQDRIYIISLIQKMASDLFKKKH